MKGYAVTFSLILLGSLAGAWAEQAPAPEAKTPVVWPAGEIKWTDSPTIKGGKVAVLWGDPKTGAYGGLKRLPGGTLLPLHTHTNDTRVLVVSGAMALSIEGGAAKEMLPGSFAYIPGGIKHLAGCKLGAECIYFEEQPGPSDIQFVGKP
jgi:quercetin dioxygenase-like cupin family protein